jgi:hypothetical protein
MNETEKYDCAMEVTTQKEADIYFEQPVQDRMRDFDSSKNKGYKLHVAERMERENLGYWAGYGSLETRARVERLFKAYHPLLPATNQRQPGVTELIQLGWKYAREHDGESFHWPTRAGPFE